jgi:uncharacterized protein
MPEVIFTGPAGRIEGRYHPARQKNAPIAIVLHPHPQFGGTMNHPIVYQLYYAFVHRNFSVLRFNFRGVGRSVGTWDDGRGEMDDYRAAVEFVSHAYPGLEIWAAGFSFGSYIAMTAGSRDDRICAMIAIAPPVNKYDFAHVTLSTKPKFIVHGLQDELIPLKSVREFYARLQEPKELVEIDRANHLFDGQAAEVGDALEDLLADFSCTTQ